MLENHKEALPRNISIAPQEPLKPGSAEDADRRAILAKLGRFGLYTAPALLVMFEADKAMAQCSRAC